jgi:hypothetical protein
VAVLCERDRAVYGVPNRSAEAASCEHEIELPVQPNVKLTGVQQRAAAGPQ